VCDIQASKDPCSHMELLFLVFCIDDVILAYVALILLCERSQISHMYISIKWNKRDIVFEEKKMITRIQDLRDSAIYLHLSYNCREILLIKK
jgi:hypothetical protein